MAPFEDEIAFLEQEILRLRLVRELLTESIQFSEQTAEFLAEFERTRGKAFPVKKTGLPE